MVGYKAPEVENFFFASLAAVLCELCGYKLFLLGLGGIFSARCTSDYSWYQDHHLCSSNPARSTDQNSASASVATPPPDSGWGRLEFCLGEKMNKADLVDRIAGACDMSKTQATAAIDTAVDSITAALKKGDRVALIGFGTFSVSQRKARNGRNPQTGATIKIAARRVAKFTPGAELKKAVNRK
jgi:nucleoid DNA-binding protein